MRLFRKFIKNKRGQSIVELALVLPLLILIVIGTMEFGGIFHSYLLITNASRQGTRAGIIGTDDTTIRSTVKNDAVSLCLTDSQITITPVQAYRTSGVPLTVQVKYSVSLISPVLDAIVPDPFPLTASTTMMVE